MHISRRQWLWGLLIVCTGCADLAAMAKVGPTIADYDKITQGMSEAEVTKILGKPSKRQMVQGGEAGSGRFLLLRWVSSNQIITVTLDGSGVRGKDRV